MPPVIRRMAAANGITTKAATMVTAIPISLAIAQIMLMRISPSFENPLFRQTLSGVDNNGRKPEPPDWHSLNKELMEPGPNFMY